MADTLELEIVTPDKLLVREHVERGKELRALRVARGGEQVPEGSGHFVESLGLLVAVDDHHQGPVEGVGEEHQVDGFRGGGEAGERELRFAASDTPHEFLEGGMAAEALEQFTDGGVGHGLAANGRG